MNTHLHGGMNFEDGLAFDHQGYSTEQFQLDHAGSEANFFKRQKITRSEIGMAGPTGLILTGQYTETGRG
ncbi:MAG: hypothetical protein AAF585_17710, partial [Verrucomicrobiota bacterium]